MRRLRLDGGCFWAFFLNSCLVFLSTPLPGRGVYNMYSLHRI